MPRRSSAGRSSSRSFHSAPRKHSPPPAAVNNSPPPAPVQKGSGSVLGNIGSTIAEGMAFGTGSAVAHRAVDAVMGPRTIQHETVVKEAAVAAPVPATSTAASGGGSDACNVQSKAFLDCLNSYGSEIGKCQFYMDMLSECRRNSGSMMPQLDLLKP